MNHEGKERGEREINEQRKKSERSQGLADCTSSDCIPQLNILACRDSSFLELLYFMFFYNKKAK